MDEFVYELWVAKDGLQGTLFRPVDHTVESKTLITTALGNTKAEDEPMLLAWRFSAPSFEVAKLVSYLLFPACSAAPTSKKLFPTAEELVALCAYLAWNKLPKAAEVGQLVTSNPDIPRGKKIRTNFTAEKLGIVFPDSVVTIAS